MKFVTIFLPPVRGNLTHLGVLDSALLLSGVDSGGPSHTHLCRTHSGLLCLEQPVVSKFWNELCLAHCKR